MKLILHLPLNSFDDGDWSSNEVDLPEHRTHFARNFGVQFVVRRSYLAA